MLLQLNNEEDFSFLVYVLYYWEQIHPTFSLKFPKTIEEYLRQKEEKLKRDAEAKNQSLNNEKAQPIAQNQPINTLLSNKIYEKLFVNLPEFNLIDENEKELPFAWFFNYMGIFADMKATKPEQRRSKVKKNVKKVWGNANLVKLEKKYEGLAKSFEDFKENDSEEDKLQIIHARNFIARMNIHIREVKSISAMLNVFGYSPISQAMSHKKALELGYLIQTGIDSLLKPINLEGFKEEIRKKIDPIDKSPPINAIPANPAPANPAYKSSKTIENTIPLKSQMVITLCDCSIYQNFDTMIDFVNSLPSNKDNFYTDCNKFTILHRPAHSGSSTCSLIHELIDFLRDYLQQNPFTLASFQKNINIALDNLAKEDR